ncbi:DUF1471 domain-containing protein [Pluralibacter gergoviae]|uniref:DUF1471 domain-containing protein n=1 Tax=Pluralibacter gergoviae TaxID=61647 RepID=A0A089PPC8_PLUGE|nr:DUF1471 domain-containing protein [Pluralibacter gergoviae]AIR02122.1 hypothetical protein LG71_20445 [Pluralibacter gergoviae]AVR03582.1 DUF1471 domain-containing protein [Pluralibacter gergoviae]EKT9642777.1 DUF1471 domain-containing protein [Pluralibacter gergoviae]EKV0913417.1 DUF1471 domain-containing protein [Pluralibacter gergoviae]EKV0928320.1 DUF1471 domain-containing protein [Pluralibacter gergoviae]
MKKPLIAAAVLFSLLTGSTFAAQLVSQQDVKHFKLVKIGTVNVTQSGGAISSPSDLHDKLSELADKKGGQYFQIIAAKQIGPNFQAVAEVYKDANK